MTYMLVKRSFESDIYHFVQPTGVTTKSGSSIEIETYPKYTLNFNDLDSVNMEPTSPAAPLYWFKISDVILTLQQYYTPHELYDLVKSDYPELLI